MALARPSYKGARPRCVLEVARKILLHPFVVATALGVASAALHFEPPVALDRLLAFLQNAAAPCALFTLGVTVALRPFTRVPWEVPPLVLIKLVRASGAGALLLSAFGPFDPDWVKTAVLMAALPPALNVFVLGAAIRGLGRAGLGLGAAWHAGFGRDAHHGDVAGAARRPGASLCSARGAMQPLSGVLVLDFTTLLPGPLATLMLAEAGAEVIKIERPGGEDMRHYEPRFDGESAMFALLNRGKTEPGARSEERGRSRQADAAAGARRRAGRAVPPGRDGAARPRLRRGAGDQPQAGLLLDHRLRPDRPARRRGRPRSQLHRHDRAAGAQSRADGPPGGAAGADRRHCRRHACRR